MRTLKRCIDYFALSPAERRHRLVGPPGVWRQKRNFQIDFLKNAGLKAGHRLLDFGCGTLRGGIPIIEYLDAGNYYGVEVSAKRLLQGRRELKESGLEHKRPFLTDDISKIDSELDFVLSFAVFDLLTDDVLDQSLDGIGSRLSGVMYADANIGERLTSWQEFPCMSRSLEDYRQRAAKHGMAVRDLGTLESLGDGTGVYSERRMLEFRAGARS